MADDTEGYPPDPNADAKIAEKAASSHRRAKNADKASAELAEDVERLEVQLNTERFLFIVSLITIADALIFTKYENWSQAICLTVIEAGGLFVLARYLEVDEFVSLLVDTIRSLRMPSKLKSEDDPN